MIVTARQLTLEMRSWVGVPFSHQGRTREGVDCVGSFVAGMQNLQAMPADFVDILNYGRGPQESLRKIVEKHCEQVRKAVEGTILLIRWDGTQPSSHLAYCAGSTLIHAYARARKVVEHSYGQPWTTKTESIWKIPTVQYE